MTVAAKKETLSFSTTRKHGDFGSRIPRVGRTVRTHPHIFGLTMVFVVERWGQRHMFQGRPFVPRGRRGGGCESRKQATSSSLVESLTDLLGMHRPGGAVSVLGKRQDGSDIEQVRLLLLVGGHRMIR
jgi:hypothetical protein